NRASVRPPVRGDAGFDAGARRPHVQLVNTGRRDGTTGMFLDDPVEAFNSGSSIAGALRGRAAAAAEPAAPAPQAADFGDSNSLDGPAFPRRQADCPPKVGPARTPPRRGRAPCPFRRRAVPARRLFGRPAPRPLESGSGLRVIIWDVARRRGTPATGRDPMPQQRTIKNVIRATGVGLHSGQKVFLTLRPAAPDTGIVFRRVDLDPVVESPASGELVSETTLCTGLARDGAKVQTVEHLMSALAGLGVDNLYVEL